ncbi:hypothetical protein ABZ769_34305 [Streptomyces olivoreticuli]
MPNDLLLPERLLALAGDFTRHNDALNALTLNGASPANTVLDHIPATQRLARETFGATDALKSQRLQYSAPVREASVRLRQLAYLATEAAEHLIDAMDLIEAARIQAASSTEPPHFYLHALMDAGSRIQLARELTALGPDDAFATAELLATEMRRQHLASDRGPARLTATQHTALRIAARGHVEITELIGKHYVSSRDVRLTITTIRALEDKGLLQRESRPTAAGGHQRVHLTTEGRRTLASTFGRPQRPAPSPPATAPPARATTAAPTR